MNTTRHPGQKVVAEGTCLYDGTIECDIRIVYSPVRFGSGDHEDPPEISGDSMIDTYYVEYGSTTRRGVFDAGGAACRSLEEALQAARSTPGVGGTVRWRRVEE